jgi:NHLM bacteriocin system ABC transporter peptidase/ATP-binding protein
MGNVMNKVKTPNLIQLEASECGSTALAIILAYYRKYVPSADIRYQCGVSRDGSDAFNLVKAAEYYGLEAKGYYANLEQLKTEVTYPAILYWRRNHFVVLEGFDKEMVYINDPALGHYALSQKEFEEEYSGVVITFKPAGHFVADGQPPKLLGPLMQRIHKLMSPIAALGLLQFILIIVSLSVALFTQVFVDQMLQPPLPFWIKQFLVLFFAIFVMQALSMTLQGFLLNRMNLKIDISLSSRFLWHVFRLPISFFQQRYVGEIMRRMEMNTEVSAFVAGQLSRTLINSAVVLIYLLVIFQYDKVMAIVAFFAILIDLGALLLINVVRSYAYARSQQIEAEFAGVTLDTLQNMESVQLLGSDQFAYLRTVGANDKIINTLQQLGKKDAFLNSLSAFISSCVSVALLGFGGWRVMFGTLTVGMFVTMQILLQRSLEPITDLLTVGLRLPLLKLDLMRLDDVLNSPVDPLIKKSEEKPVEEKLPPVEGDINIKGISFGYQPLDEPLFKELNLSVQSKKALGITGPNGSGKSTLMRLILGHYLPWQGQIVVGGQELQTIPYPELQESILFVEQENLFFPGTVYENLTLWNPYINERDLVRACKAACIDDEIMKRPGGYHYRMNENASDFSQGQKQRLGIARALLANPKTLIIDEALSGLDTKVQTEVIQNVKKLIPTLLLISHRNSVLMLCDRLLVFDKGRIVQDGKPEELLK